MSHPSISTELLDELKRCLQGCRENELDLSYVPEVIWTELTRKYHDESTLVLRKFEDLLPEKNTSYNLILVGMIHYKPTQKIDIIGPAKVFIDLIV